MVLLSPEDAYRVTVLGHVTVGGFSILVWDILTHLPADYRLLTDHKISFPTMIYYLSRWSTLFYTASCVIFQTAPIGNCATALKVTCSVYHVTTSSTALLFFLRVRAIFNKNRYITIGFFILWLAVLGGSLTAITSLSGVRIGDTKYCTFSNIKAYRSAANITLAIFDTCVFIAITWRLSRNQVSVGIEGSERRRFDLLGKYLPVFSRALLQDGQKYYMVAMVANLLVVTMEFAPGVPPIYRTLFLTSATVLTNIMACRVFRHTKLNHDNEDARTPSGIVFTRSNNIPVFIHGRGHNMSIRSASSGTSEMSRDTAGAPSDGYFSTEKDPHFSKEVGLAVKDGSQ